MGHPIVWCQQNGARGGRRSMKLCPNTLYQIEGCFLRFWPELHFDWAEDFTGNW